HVEDDARRGPRTRVDVGLDVLSLHGDESAPGVRVRKPRERLRERYVRRREVELGPEELLRGEGGGVLVRGHEGEAVSDGDEHRGGKRCHGERGRSDPAETARQKT